MFSKLFSLCVILATCNAGHLGYHTNEEAFSSQNIVQEHLPIIQHHQLNQHEGLHHDHYSHETSYPKYKFEYSVTDPKTEDQKTHWENRDGDAVKGQYTLLQPDGSTRIVTYSADNENGFHAEVSNTAEGTRHHQALSEQLQGLEIHHTIPNFQHYDAIPHHHY